MSYTPGHDFCTIKYVHHKGSLSSLPVYGTIHLYNDGTMSLTLQPPKLVREFHPKVDFHHFQKRIQEAFDGLTSFDSFDLKEISAKFTIKLKQEDKKLTGKRLRQRLPTFQSIFKEIPSLPKDSPILSLRYKAVNQYHTEEPVMIFISQLVFEYQLKGEVIQERFIIENIENEFNMIQSEAQTYFLKWIQNKDDYTIQIPEENEFIETFHPGTDIHIYAQHPAYFIQVNRVTEYESYFRIFTFLSLLFTTDDSYFVEEQDINPLEVAIEQKEKEKEREIFVNDFDFNEQNGEEKEKEKEEKEKEIKAIEENLGIQKVDKLVFNEDQRSINPKGWFLKRLQYLEPGLFKFKKGESDVYSRKCGSIDDRQPNIMTKDQYERMREIYRDDNIHWIVYPLDSESDPIPPLHTEETVTVMRYGLQPPSTIHYYFCPHYFCLSDEIMIREVDFMANVDRDGEPKPSQSCPFCKGLLITNHSEAMSGYTVLKRKGNKGSGKHQGFIKFLSKTTNPNGYSMPCCFAKPSALRLSDPSFSHIRDVLQEQETELENEEEIELENEEEQEIELENERIMQKATEKRVIYN
jgi:hypothetical protein